MTATAILFEHGIDLSKTDDNFNTQLLHALERYAELRIAELMQDIREYKDLLGFIVEDNNNCLKWEHELRIQKILNK